MIAANYTPEEAKLMMEFSDLVERFSLVMLEKLLANERKYGFGLSWKVPDWEKQLQTDIVKHVQKGDPRDVAIFSLFAWYHNWQTGTIPPPSVYTLQGWEESGLSLYDYLLEPCEIDQELYLYIGEVVPPKYLGTTLIQGGDALRSDIYNPEILFYHTVLESQGKYYHIGVLPEFKQ